MAQAQHSSGGRGGQSMPVGLIPTAAEPERMALIVLVIAQLGLLVILRNRFRAHHGG